MNETRLILPDPTIVRHADWRDRLGAFADRCEAAFASEEEPMLRRLSELLAEAPDAGVLDGLARNGWARFEALIAAGACDSAVLSLLGANCGYVLSRGPAGEHIASLVLPERTMESTATGDSLALALSGAIALALCSPRDVVANLAGISAFRLN